MARSIFISGYLALGLPIEVLFSINQIPPRTLIGHIPIINIPTRIASTLLDHISFDQTVVKCQCGSKRGIIGPPMYLLPSRLLNPLSDPIIQNSFNADKPRIIYTSELRHIHVVCINTAIRVRQYSRRLFRHYKSDYIHRDSLVVAEDLHVIKRSVSC